MDVQKCPLTKTEKNNMITEAAFLRSRNRDYPGDPVADWLAAEDEIEGALAADCRSVHEEEDLSAYRRMRKELRRILGKAEAAVNAETLKKALAMAAADLRQAGEFVPGSIDRASIKIRRELSAAIEKLGKNWDHFRIRRDRVFAIWKDKGYPVVNRATQSFSEWISRWRDRNGG